MRRLLMILAVGLFLTMSPCLVDAQVTYGGDTLPYRVNGSIGLPDLYGTGHYGTSWGVASFGIPRTYTTFSSPSGLGYGYGYPPYGVLPGRFGVGLWRPGFVAPGYTYGSAYGYNTFPYPYRSGGPMYGPPMGAYAPGFGPGQPPGSYAN